MGTFNTEWHRELIIYLEFLLSVIEIGIRRPLSNNLKKKPISGMLEFSEMAQEVKLNQLNRDSFLSDSHCVSNVRMRKK